MSRKNTAAASLALAMLCGGAIGQQIEYVETPGEMEFSGEMIVRPIQLQAHLDGGVGAERAQGVIVAARAAVGAYEIKSYYPETDEYVIRVPKGLSENEVANALMATGNFQYVEPNWTVFVLDTPNDPLLNNQWHHNANRMNSALGWDIHTGGPGVTVAICDTGVQTSHPDLLLHRKEGYNATTQLWENNGGQIGATGSHGTQTTGCAAANGDNGVGVSGVGWNLSHRMMRVSENGSSSSMEVLTRGARTAVLERGDRVSNVSFSGVNSSAVRTTATVIKNAGGLLVWSAGNNGANLNWGDRDADDVIVVGATTSSDNLSGFSAFGRSVDLVAPGSSVFTTTTGSSYGSVSGTSFSAPLTAGLIGLIWSANPSLSPDEVEDILKAGADDLGASGVDNTFGYGRIEILGSLSLVSNPVEFDYPNGLVDQLDPSGGTTVRVEVLAADDNPISGTGMLHYNDGNGWVAVAMNEVSDNVYDAVFPGFDCAAGVSYYFSSDATDGGNHTDPRDAPDSSFSATAFDDVLIAFEDNFEGDQGWTATNLGASSGDWQRGVPVNDGSWEYDPTSDGDGSGSAYLTQNQNGNTDVDGGAVRLTSPQFDMSGDQGFTIEYLYYLRLTNSGAEDGLLVEISGNGNAGPWTTVVDHRTDGGTDWRANAVTDADLAGLGVGLTNNMRMRFTARDNDPQSINESGIDGFRVSALTCGDDGCAADLDGDNDADADDFFAYLDLFAGGDDAADLDDDGDVDADDFFGYLDLFAAGC